MRSSAQTWVAHKNSLIFLSFATPAAINYNYDCNDTDNNTQVKNGILNAHHALVYSHTTGWTRRKLTNSTEYKSDKWVLETICLRHF